MKRREEVRETIRIIYFCPRGFCGGKSVTVLRFIFSALIMPVLHIYSYISRGTDKGPLEAAVPRDVGLSASQKKGTALLSRHLGSKH